MNQHDAYDQDRKDTFENPEQLDATALAKSRRDAMRRRARKIRKSVAAAAAALFVAAFLAVYVQLASGHDPALSAKSKASATSNLLSSTGASEPSSAATSEASSTSTESEASQTSESATPVITSQS